MSSKRSIKKPIDLIPGMSGKTIAKAAPVITTFPLNVVPAANLITPPKENMPEEENLSEHDVLKYLSEKSDNIIMVLGQKVYRMNRSSIKYSIKKPENIFVDSEGKKFYQIVGRHLVDEDEIKFITSKKLSIYNISTLKNVVKVNSKGNPILMSRSVYNVEPYTVEEYKEMVSE